MAEMQTEYLRSRREGLDDGHVHRCHFDGVPHTGFIGDIDDGETMKVQVKSADDAAEFIRERMLESMNRSVASMQQSGCSPEEIRLMVADTLDKIAEMSVDVDDVFAALTKDFEKVFN
jgi:hypothetical protein